MDAKKILIVEDDKMLSTVFSMFINDLGYELSGFYQNGKDAIENCKHNKPDVILMDIHLPGEIDGINAANTIQSEFDIPVIFLTSDVDPKTIEKASMANSYGYLVKPIEKHILGISIEMAYAKHKYDRDIRVKESRYRTLIEDAPHSVIVFSDGLIQYVNPAGLSLLGTIYIEDLLEKELISFIDIKHQKEFIENINEALSKNKKVKHFSADIHTVNNKKIKADISGSIIEFKGKPAIQLIIRENRFIGEENISLIRNNNANDELNSIFNSSTEGLIVVNKDFTILNANKASNIFIRKIKKSTIEKGQNILELVDFIENNEATHLFKNSLEGITHYIERTLHINGEKKIFKIKIFPIIERSTNQINKFCISLNDISESKKTKRELKQIKTELKPLFDSSIQRFYLSDFDFTIVAFNKAAKDIIKKEFNSELKKGDSLLNLIPLDIEELEFRNMFQKARNGEHVTYKSRIIINNKEYWTEGHIDPVSNDRGEIYRILLWTIDTTKEKLAEEALLESQKKFYSLFSEANDAILVIDDDKNGSVIVDCNSKAIDLFGYAREEMLGVDSKQLSPIYQPDGQKSKELRSFKIDELRKGVNNTYIWRYEKKNGETFDAEVSLSYIVLESGKFYHAIIRDISKRIEAEKSLKINQQKNSSLLSAFPDTILTLDKDGGFIDYTEGEVTIGNKTISDRDSIDSIYDFETSKNIRDSINKVLTTKKLHQIVFKQEDKTYEGRLSLLEEDKILFLVRDITDFN